MTQHAPAPHGSPSHSPQHGQEASRHQHQHGADPQEGLAEILDLDAELFAPYLAGVMRRIAERAGDGVRHIIDIGAGSGTGTFALLKQFPAARVTAVDSSAPMLERLARTAAAKGLAAQVHPLEADAGTSLPGVTGADLVWASASLHHMDDPAAALRTVLGALRPGGLLAVAELDGMPRFLADDAVPERPGLESRCRESLAALHTEQVPHLGADWSALLTSAGLIVEEEHTEHLRLTAPFPGDAGLYAYRTLSRIRGALDGRVDPADLAAFDTLLDGGAQDVRRRDDLVVRSTRQLWIARRPADG